MISSHKKNAVVRYVFYGDKSINSVQWQGKEILPKWQVIELSTEGVSVIDGDFSVEPEDWVGYHEVILKDEENADFVSAFSDFQSEFIYLSPSFKLKSSEIMFSMFSRCNRLRGLDLANLDTSKTENLMSMFNECSSLTELDLSNFDTSKVKNFDYMFSGCSKLERLNLSSFAPTEDVSAMGMFYGCEHLKELDLSSFDASKIYSSYTMFGRCYAIKKIYCRTADDAKIFKEIGDFGYGVDLLVK